MKILHLTTMDHGGAGLAAYRLHHGLQARGADSSMLVLEKHHDDRTIQAVPQLHGRRRDDARSPWTQVWERWQRLLRAYPERPEGLELFSGVHADTDLKNHPLLRQADIVNLHWVAGLLDTGRMAETLAGKTVVWTLHDMNPFTGGCHYSGDCRKYRERCQACPQLGSADPDDLASRNWLARMQSYAPLAFSAVTPSAWLAREARGSALFSRFDATVIPNGQPLDVFRPLPRQALAEAMNIDPKAIVVLYGAEAHTERKGWRFMRELRERIPSRIDGREVLLVSFGQPAADCAPPAGIKSLDFGHVQDPNVMAALYSIADVYVLPTIEDNLPNTVVEAMACGTPCAGFNVGGMPDLVVHGRNGYLAEVGDVDGLMRGIEWCLAQGDALRAMNAERARELYSIDRQAASYMQLYERLLGDTRKTTPPSRPSSKACPHSDASSFLNLANFYKKRGDIARYREYMERYAAGQDAARPGCGDRPAAPPRPQAQPSAPRTVRKSPESRLAHAILDGLTGLEVGPSTRNPFGLRTRNVGRIDPIYEEEQLQTTGEVAPIHIQATADAIPVPSESEDFVISSHVIEHAPDFIRTMLEWYRIVKPGGYIFMITPHRDAAPSDRGKPLTSWEHMVEDYVRGVTPDMEPEAGVFGHCHYHVFSIRTMKGFVRSIFGHRLDLVAEQERDDKVGNGFTLVYRKKAGLGSAFPWTMRAKGGAVIQARIRTEHVQAAREPVKGSCCEGRTCPLTPREANGECPLQRAADALARRQPHVVSGAAPIAMAVNLVPTSDRCWSLRQQLCIRALAPLRGAGIVPVNLCYPGEQWPDLGWEQFPSLVRRADVTLGVPGKPKPFMNDIFDAAADAAEQLGLGWFGYLNNDIVLEPKLLDIVQDRIARGFETVIAARNEVRHLDGQDGLEPGPLVFTAFDAFFCSVAWWRANSSLFQPYIIGERGWDDAYASIMLGRSKAWPVLKNGACLHVTHETIWEMEASPYSRHNLSLYAGADRIHSLHAQAWFDILQGKDVPSIPDREMEAMIAELFVNGPAPDAPPEAPDRYVNITMITYNRLSFTKQAVSSIIRRTRFPYVLTVVDNGSTDGTPDYLTELKRKGIIKNLVLLEENLGVAKAANIGWLQEPEARYYMKLDNDIVMTRNDWLDAMIDVAEAVPEIGALGYNVEPRSYPLIRGKGRTFRVTSGNLGGACILIPKRTHDRLGFWNEQYGLYGEEDADYGMRIACAGLLNAYMENEDAAFHLPAGKAACIDSSSLIAKDGVEEVIDAGYRAWKDAQRKVNVRKRDFFFERYRTDPSSLYHATVYAPSSQGRRPSGLAKEPAAALLRVMHCTRDKAIPFDRLRRIVQPNLALMRQRKLSWYWKSFDELAENACLDDAGRILPDIYTLQWSDDYESARRIIDFAHANGRKVICAADDLLTRLPEGHPEEEKHRRMRPMLEALLGTADAAVVATDMLKRELAPLARRIHVVADAIDLKSWPASETRLPGRDRTVIGCIGTASQPADLRLLAGPVRDMLAKYGDRVLFKFWNVLPEELSGLPGVELELVGADDYKAYARRLASCDFDFALVPLADNAFNRCKSNMAYLEYAACRIPGVFSDLEPYACVENGKTGLLAADSPQAWLKAMTAFMENPGFRASVAEAAHDRAESEFAMERSLAALLACYAETVAGQSEGENSLSRRAG